MLTETWSTNDGAELDPRLAGCKVDVVYELGKPLPGGRYHGVLTLPGMSEPVGIVRLTVAKEGEPTLNVLELRTEDERNPAGQGVGASGGKLLPIVKAILEDWRQHG